MKFVAVILVGCLLSSCAHDEDMAAAFGLIIGAAVLTAVVDDIEDDDRDHRRGYGHHGRGARWGNDRGDDERGGRGRGRRER